MIFLSNQQRAWSQGWDLETSHAVSIQQHLPEGERSWKQNVRWHQICWVRNKGSSFSFNFIWYQVLQPISPLSPDALFIFGIWCCAIVLSCSYRCKHLTMPNSRTFPAFQYYSMTALSFVSDTCVQHVLLVSCDTTKVAPCILELLICEFLILNQIFGGAAYQEVLCSMEITILGFQLVKIGGVRGGGGNASVKLMYHQYSLHVSLVFAFFPKSPPAES